MKLSKKEQEQINTLVRKYADKGFKLKPEIVLSASLDHDKFLCAVCLLLRHYIKTPFYTEFKMQGGLRPDVFAPLHTKKFIEILHSESFFDWEKMKGEKYKKLGIDKKDILFIKPDKPVKVKDLQ
jgi:hypothetical protein